MYLFDKSMTLVLNWNLWIPKRGVNIWKLQFRVQLDPRCENLMRDLSSACIQISVLSMVLSASCATACLGWFSLNTAQTYIWICLFNFCKVLLLLRKGLELFYSAYREVRTVHLYEETLNKRTNNYEFQASTAEKESQQNGMYPGKAKRPAMLSALYLKHIFGLLTSQEKWQHHSLFYFQMANVSFSNNVTFIFLNSSCASVIVTTATGKFCQLNIQHVIFNPLNICFYSSWRDIHVLVLLDGPLTFNLRLGLDTMEPFVLFFMILHAIIGHKSTAKTQPEL